MKNKLDEIGCVRNALAHFRPLKQEDVALLKQNAKHVLTNVEETIEEVCGCYAPVPTNTTESWYSDLVTLGSDHCKVALTQSPKTAWVGISVNYSVPVLSKTDYGSWHYIQLLNLSAVPSLEMSDALRESVTFASEQAICPPYTLEEGFSATKGVQFVISRSALATDHTKIKSDLETLLREIERETELISQDNLAAGRLVRNVTLVAEVPKADAKDKRLKAEPNRLIAADTGECRNIGDP